MNLSQLAGARHQELFWVLVAAAAAMLALHLARPAERRSLRVAWVLLALAFAAQVLVALAPDGAPVSHGAHAAALLLGGLAVIQVAGMLVFRGLLPAVHFALPRIAQDLTVTALSVAWCLLWLRLSGVDPSQLFTTSAIITAVVAFSMQDTLGNVLGGVALQLDSSLRVGDWVRLDDISGRVVTIKDNENWRAAAAKREFDRRVAAIRGTELFARLPGPEQEALASHLVHAPFAAGDLMTRQGAVAHWLYLIIHGEAKVLVDGPGGAVQVTTLRDGDVFGEMGMLTGEPRRATVVALTAVECYRLDKGGFGQVLKERPEIAREVSAIAEARNASTAQRLMRGGAPPPPHGDLLGRILHFFSIAA